MTIATQAAIAAVFTNRSDAYAAIRELKRVGIPEDQLGMIARNDQGETAESLDGGTMMAEGAAAGAVTGAGVGALWALGAATLGLPAIGPVVAGGVLAAILASAAGGAAAGGLVGGLIGLGVPEEEAQYYEGEVKLGRTLVTVRDPFDPGEVASILRNHGGYNLQTSAPPQDIPVVRKPR